MENTFNLQLPYIMPSQAQKHVTHNEALVLLDAIVQLGVRDRDLAHPPEGVPDGARYIVAASATGEWAGWEGAIAFKIDGGWQRIEPQTGWLSWVADEEILVCWNGAIWFVFQNSSSSFQDIPLLGVGTIADNVNPFSAKLNKALWTARYDAEGGDGSLRYTLNKETASDTLSLLMQTGWSGRVELGLTGNDDFTVKTSGDGLSWKEAIRINPTTGVPRFPQAKVLSALAPLSGAAGSFPRFTGNGENSAVMQAIVGAVSHASGVVTGALVERGSNANGSYFRFAGGLQLCVGTKAGIPVQTLDGSLYRSTAISMNFPAEFAWPGANVLTRVVSGGVSSNVQWGALTTGFTSGVIYSLFPYSDGELSYLAIGSWH